MSGTGRVSPIELGSKVVGAAEFVVQIGEAGWKFTKIRRDGLTNIHVESTLR